MYCETVGVQHLVTEWHYQSVAKGQSKVFIDFFAMKFLVGSGLV